MKKNFLLDMAKFNKIALILFILAKITGSVGVCLGFLGSEYHTTGLVLLIFSFLCIGLSVTFSILQMSKDKKQFATEDQESAKLQQILHKKMQLEEEIAKLQLQKNALINLKIRNNI
jgi:fatty acid desaturase